MKKTYRQAFVILSLFFICAIPAQKATAQDDAYVSYNDFYQNLAPYGQWIQDPQYGYVWSPNVDASFRPYYTNGNWVMTNYGNTWVSNYPWGWACFHYGRWTYDAYYGWLWIPGSDWGPAWVSWRYGEGNYGWAPLGPGYEFSSSYGDYNCPNDWWVFIPPQYMYSGNYYRYWYGPHGNSDIIGNTVIINNTYVNNNVTYVGGPRSSDVENITHHPVQVYNLASSSSANLNTRVHNNTVKMYRPAQVRPEANNTGGGRPIPPNVISVTQPISRPQSAGTAQGAKPVFRSNIPDNTRPADAVGTHFNEPQKANPPQNTSTHLYEWDVNKPIPQPQSKDASASAPESHSEPQRVPQQSQPQQQPHQQQQQPRPAAAPQQAPHAAPAAPRQGSGGRR